jgi:hypothetical protein
VVLGALALVGVLAVIAFWPSSSTVPDVVGQTQSEAERSAGDGYKIDVDEVRVDDKPKGTIIEQNPEPGAPAEQGSPISVIVSAGQPPDPGDIFRDDFSDTSSGWQPAKGGEKDPWVVEYVIGGLRFYNGSNDIFLHRVNNTAGTAIEDAIVEVDATVITNAPLREDTTWGLICRAVDYENFYQLGIYANGRPTIWKLKDSKWTHLVSGSPSDVVRGGTSTNHLRADCLGSRLTLYANGRRVLEAEDSEFKSGLIGLYVDGNGGEIDILFDNFLVSSP